MTSNGLLDGALLRAIVRLEEEVAALRRLLEVHTAVLESLLPDAPPPAPCAPLATGGGAAPAEFPATFRGRTGGRRRAPPPENGAA